MMVLCTVNTVHNEGAKQSVRSTSFRMSPLRGLTQTSVSMNYCCPVYWFFSFIVGHIRLPWRLRFVRCISRASFYRIWTAVSLQNPYARILSPNAFGCALSATETGCQ